MKSLLTQPREGLLKTCKKCGESLPIEDFYKHKMMGDGYLSFCKTCVKQRVAAHREANLERVREYDRQRASDPRRVAAVKQYEKRWNSANPDAKLAHGRVSYAVRRGVLDKPDCCPRCGSVRAIVAHHQDYSRPLDVEWLCQACHVQLHVAEAKAS